MRTITIMATGRRDHETRSEARSPQSVDSFIGGVAS
eukprot:COSAG06_NODE_313_length_17764_cov_4.287235_19_plen_36_part_00